MTDKNKTMGLLYLSYGTPRSEEEIIPYLTSIRGRQPSQPELSSLKRRYDIIGSFEGGFSPLNEATHKQGQALETYLNARGGNYRLYEGYKHLTPSIEEAVEAMHRDGIEEAVLVAASPFYSALGTADYGRRAKAVADRYGMTIYRVDAWWNNLAFITCWQESIKALGAPGDAYYIFSAHSLPQEIVTMGDPYVEDVGTAAKRLAQGLGLDHYCQAWQSAPPRGRWMEPKVDQVIQKALDQGYKHIVIIPLGFITEHLEVLYDDDVVYREQIEAGGAHYYRPSMPNDSALLIESMASAVACVKG